MARRPQRATVRRPARRRAHRFTGAWRPLHGVALGLIVALAFAAALLLDTAAVLSLAYDSLVASPLWMRALAAALIAAGVVLLGRRIRRAIRSGGRSGGRRGASARRAGGRGGRSNSAASLARARERAGPDAAARPRVARRRPASRASEPSPAD